MGEIVDFEGLEQRFLNLVNDYATKYASDLDGLEMNSYEDFQTLCTILEQRFLDISWMYFDVFQPNVRNDDANEMTPEAAAIITKTMSITMGKAIESKCSIIQLQKINDVLRDEDVAIYFEFRTTIKLLADLNLPFDSEVGELLNSIDENLVQRAEILFTKSMNELISSNIWSLNPSSTVDFIDPIFAFDILKTLNEELNLVEQLKNEGRWFESEQILVLRAKLTRYLAEWEQRSTARFIQTDNESRILALKTEIEDGVIVDKEEMIIDEVIGHMQAILRFLDL